MRKLQLTKEFQFLSNHYKDNLSLCRIGGYRDGGYVLPFDAILKTKKLVSIGIGSTARFESDFYDLNQNAQIIMIDKGLSCTRVIARTIYHFLRNRDMGYNSLVENVTLFRMMNHANIIRKFIDHDYGIDNLISAEERSIILKMDIEGHEYSQLPILEKLQKSFAVLCIEFHDLHITKNLLLLEKFLNKINLNICFVSINETSLKKGFPSILEITLCNKNYVSKGEGYLQSSSFPGTIATQFFEINEQ